MKLRGIIHGFESTNGEADEERLNLNIVFPIQVGSVATVIIGETQPEHVPAEDASADRRTLEQMKLENASLRELAGRLACWVVEKSDMHHADEVKEWRALTEEAKKAGLL